MGFKRALLGLLLLAARPGGGTDFDGRQKKDGAFRAPVEGAPGSAPSPESLWLSFGAEDLAHPRWAELGLGRPALRDGGGAVFEFPKEKLPELSEKMHELFNRCGGFFSHESRAQAEADLKPFPKAPRIGYSLDQRASVEPMLSQVSEEELRGTIEALAGYHNRYYQSESGVAAAAAIEQRWAGLAKGLAGASTRLFKHPDWKQPSVILTIPGAEAAEEIVVLGGHLDSIGGWWGGAKARAPGADDNASGIAVLSEALRVLALSGFRPRRTIEIMGYAAEEVGLRGSQEIARQYAAAGKKVVGVIQFDMTNFKGSAEDIFILGDNVEPGLSAFLGELVDGYALGRRGVTNCGYGCSDHASWTKAGFAAAAAFESAKEDMNAKIHGDGDTLANSGGTAAHSVPFAKLALAFAVELAKAAGPAPGSAGR